jgi:hypothetical protein
MSGVTLIGDVHGKYKRYHEIIREKDRHPYTIQLGDFGFNYDTLKNVDPDRHKFIGGNHDNYDIVTQVPHYLGDFGNFSLNGVDFFFYRGAHSIDRMYRTAGVDWWMQEENTIETFMEARKLYAETKPKVVLTHCCPTNIIPSLLPPFSQIMQSTTDWALQELYNIHQPELWIFGHYHVSRVIQNSWVDTKFVCVNELEMYHL